LNGERKIKVMHLVGTNPVLAYANAREVFQALMNVDFISVVDLYMSPTARFADIVMPAAHWLEMDDIYDMHPRFFVSAIVKAVEPPGEAWPDNKIFLELGKRLAPSFWPFENVEEMLDYQLRKANTKWEEFKKWASLAPLEWSIMKSTKPIIGERGEDSQPLPERSSFIAPYLKNSVTTLFPITENPQKVPLTRKSPPITL